MNSFFLHPSSKESGKREPMNVSISVLKYIVIVLYSINNYFSSVDS